MGADWLAKRSIFVEPRLLREHCLNGCGNKPAGFGFGALGIFELAHSMSGHAATCLTFP